MSSHLLFNKSTALLKLRSCLAEFRNSVLTLLEQLSLLVSVSPQGV
jgi:hypothetical protein